MKIANKDIQLYAPKSITPSGFFGSSSDNIIELENFLTEDERQRLISFALNNKVWDQTETHVDEDGLVLYDANIWKDRVCTHNSLMESDPTILELINSMIARLKIEVDKLIEVLLDRLYTLRNQIMHGGATYKSKVNRAQVRDACNILKLFIPIIIDIMMEHWEEDWGEIYYPVVG